MADDFAFNPPPSKAGDVDSTGKTISHWEVYDSQTGKVVGKHSTRKRAQNSVNKKDDAYGGYRYTHRKAYKEDI